MSGFHGNQVLQRMVDQMVARAGVTSFVETGTHYAHTTLHMASRHPGLPIFTCEINPTYYAASLLALRPHANVQVSPESSEKYVVRLIGENALGAVPMFFLDAHWHDYWPLPDEVREIAKLPKFVILVDDFMVPGQAQFETSAGGGGTIGEHRTKPDTRPCDMSLIGQLLPADCAVGYPQYGKVEAYGTPHTPHLVGYVIIMRGIGEDGVVLDGMHSWGGIR